MYLSPYTDRTGRHAFTGELESYRYILGDAKKEEAVLGFIKREKITGLSMYDLHRILPDANRRNNWQVLWTARVGGTTREAVVRN
jgi:hypothetical protein